MKPNRQPTRLTEVFNPLKTPPIAKREPSLHERVKNLNKLLSKPVPTLEYAPGGSVNGNFNRDRDRTVRHEIRGLEARIAKKGNAASQFKAAHLPGTTMQSFNKRSRRR